jgi:hypothetical protein
MKRQFNRIFILLFILFSLPSLTKGQNTDVQNGSLKMDSILKQGPEYNFINPLVGHWHVIQTIYAMGEQKALSQDTFKVESKMIGNFLQETMRPIKENKTNTFTRTSYLNYNRSNQRWEYIVLDTRYPLMMFETGFSPVTADGRITLNLDAFIVPPFWGMSYAGMLGRQRRVITFKKDVTINEQYWTLPGRKEFLAIKYIFKRENSVR